MSALSPTLLAERIGHGLLSFPVTHFDANLEFDEAAYRDHLSWQSKYDVAGLFAAGGTGEFFSLTPAEVDRVVRVAVDEVNGAVPLLAPAGQSVALARQQVKNAEEAGADGILLFPPYLTEASKSGIASYVEAICSATNLGVILYNRANGRIDAPTLERLAVSCPNLIGFKDGVGDIELMTQIYARLGDRFTYIGGLPTAETFALPYLRLGVTTYSSAIFNFAPEFALGYYDSVTSGDVDAVYTKLREFVLPYLEVRNRVAGYAVSIVKAGLTAAGRPGSPVRPPLLDLTPADLADLTELVARVK